MDWVTLYIIASLLLVPMFIYSVFASYNVDSVFNKFKDVHTSAGVTAAEFTQKLLKQANIDNVTITKIGGNLTDCYDPRKKVVKLSASTYDSTSISALGVCAHEVGHAVQDNRKMFLFRLRIFFVPIVNIINGLYIPLIFVGSILAFTFMIPTVGYYIVLGSVIAYGASLLFYFITLPLEYDASRRALAMMKEMNTFTETELAQAKQVLKAAIQTYIAATLISLIYFLRFLSYAMIFTSNKKK